MIAERREAQLKADRDGQRDCLLLLLEGVHCIGTKLTIGGHGGRRIDTGKNVPLRDLLCHVVALSDFGH